MTVKLDELVAVCDPMLTVIEPPPTGAPVGTVTVNDVELPPVTIAATLLNFTILFVAGVVKLKPLMVTVVPGIPLAGEKPVMMGVVTVNDPVLVTV